MSVVFPIIFNMIAITLAHLDDGTMVVVDHAKRWIGKYVEVVVTSVIQTSAGRMIFSSVGENARRLQASFG